MEHLYQIAFERLDAQTVRLSQETGCGNDDSVIDLNQSQLLYIARRMAGLTEGDTERIADLERRIGILADDLESLVADPETRRTIAHCEGGFELLARFDGLLDLAVEFDGHRLVPRSSLEAQESHTRAPSSAPSTSTSTKQERPAKSDDDGDQLALDV